VFNREKLDWMNAQHLRAKSAGDLSVLVRPLLAEAGIDEIEDRYLKDVITLMRERVTKPQEFLASGFYFFADPEGYDEQATKKNWKPGAASSMTAVAERLASLEVTGPSDFEQVIRSVADQLQVGAGKLIHPLRLALTGVSAGPGLFELMAVLGRERCIRRIQRAVLALG